MNSTLRTLTILFLFFSSSAQAQILDFSKMRFGLRGGMSAANLLSTEGPRKYATGCTVNCDKDADSQFYTFDYKGGLKNTRFGLIGGIFVEQSISTRLAIELGVNYEQKGLSLEHSSYTRTQNGPYLQEEWQYYKRDINNDYLVFPVISKFAFGSSSRFYAIAGFYVGFLMKSDGTALDSMVVLESQNGTLYSGRGGRMRHSVLPEHTSTFDAGVIFGGGTKWPIGEKLYLHLEARANVGFLKVDAEHNNDSEKLKTQQPFPGPGPMVTGNYQRGLNPESKNVNTTLTAGISRSF